VPLVLIFITEVEFHAVMHHMKPLPGHDKIIWSVPKVESCYIGRMSAYTAALMQCNMGSLSALFAVTDTITKFNAKAVIMIGIAFGLKPKIQKLGDVLVSTQLATYDLQQVSRDRVIPRGNILPCSAPLGARFKSGETEDWDFRWFYSAPRHRGVRLQACGLRRLCDRVVGQISLDEV
jgi:nucleoside phosphorylase